MSEFSVRIVRIEDVSAHPNADRLSLVRILGFDVITAKLEDGSHRYRVGDLVAYVPEGSVVPEYLLRQEGLWDAEEGRGLLSGSKGTRVKTKRLRGIVSQGLMFPTLYGADAERSAQLAHRIFDQNNVSRVVVEDDDVADFLGITKWEPVIPVHLAGEQAGSHFTRKYDFESIQKHPNLFTEGEMVHVTEKLHGTCFQIGFIPAEDNEDGTRGSSGFFGEDRDIYITSKGLGASGRIIRNSESNADNLYVRIFQQLEAQGLGAHLRDIYSWLEKPAPIRLFGEIFGSGVQDLTYGQSEPIFRLFDVMIGEDFLAPEDMELLVAYKLHLPTVPVLWKGPFSLEKMIELRDGKEMISGKHMREGIVIRSMNAEKHPRYGRKIGKFVSPDYLLRKGETTEFQ